ELKKVVTAVFTDPSDQSPWFFLRWLLAGKNKNARLQQTGIFLFEETVSLVLVFTEEINNPSGLSLLLNGEVAAVDDIRSHHHSKYIWFVSLPKKEKYDLRITLDCLKEERHISTTLKLLPVYQYFPDSFKLDKISPKAKETLLELKNDCVTLDNLDSNNK
ncbi:hypothetical protein Avbf_07246, partial [Armadillidium vulgare]